MKSSISIIIIITVSFLVGCKSLQLNKPNVSDYQHDIRLAKGIQYPISKLDKYSQMVLLINNEQIKEITYKYQVNRDEPSPIFKVKRNKKNYFVLKVIHPSDGVSIKANGFKQKILVSEGGLNVSPEIIEFIPDNFSGVLKVKLEPVKK